MRKGSKKPLALSLDELKGQNIVSPEQLTESQMGKIVNLQPATPSTINLHESPVLVFKDSVRDILMRLCDACHEMDNRVEPWASIRKEIEALR
jgi:hypothetical protein